MYESEAVANYYNWLNYLIFTGQVEEIKEYTHQIKINHVPSSGLHPLTVAVLMNQPEIVDLLLKQGCYSHQQDKRGHSLFYTAICLGYEEIVKLLFKSQTTTAGESILLYSSEKFGDDYIISAAYLAYIAKEWKIFKYLNQEAEAFEQGQLDTEDAKYIKKFLTVSKTTTQEFVKSQNNILNDILRLKNVIAHFQSSKLDYIQCYKFFEVRKDSNSNSMSKWLIDHSNDLFDLNKQCVSLESAIESSQSHSRDDVHNPYITDSSNLPSPFRTR